MSDLISRKWLMECVDEGWIKFDTEKDKNIYVHLVRDIAPSAQPEPEEDCDTCKHGYFGDSQCNNCRMRFPSHYEREEEQHEET